MTILEEANTIIYGPRRGAYGTPLDNFALTAKLWSPILGIEVTPEQIALCMIQLKVAREIHVHKRDNLVDIAGYAGTLMEVHDERSRREHSGRRTPVSHLELVGDADSSHGEGAAHQVEDAPGTPTI